jgi:hypothetical protein
MPIRQGRKVTELTALNSASLNTYVIGVDNNVTYKMSLDVLENAIINIVTSSVDARLNAIELYTASYTASSNFDDLINKPVIISSSQQITNFGFISSSQIINTSSLATTGSNIFVGNQYISGAVEIYDEFAVDAYPTLLQKFSDGTFGISNGRVVAADGILIPAGHIQLILNNDANSTFDTSITNIDEVGLQISASGTNDAIMELVGYSLNIQNTLTASINEGFVWVGNSENKTYLISTASFASTGSNIFVGKQILQDESSNPFSIYPFSGSLILIGHSYNSASNHISASSNDFINLIFKDSDTEGSTIISGSNNLIKNPNIPTTGFVNYIKDSNIALQGHLPQISASMQFPIDINGNILNAHSNVIMRGPSTATYWTINANYIAGATNGLSIGTSVANNAEKLIGQLTVNNNVIQNSLQIIANNRPIEGASMVSSNSIIGNAALNLYGDAAVVYTQNYVNGTNQFTTHYSSESAVSVIVSSTRNTFSGNSNNFTITGSYVTGSTTVTIADNASFGANNISYVNTNSQLAYKDYLRTLVAGSNLIISGSNWANDTNNAGTIVLGRNNANDGVRNKTRENILVVGTGNSTTNRKTGFLIDSGSNIFVEGTFNVSGSSNFNGNQIITGSITATSFTGSFDGDGSRISNVATKFTGSWSVPSGASTQSFTVDANNSYTMWVNGNIPNGIIVWNATITISNTNVPAIGTQYGWYYSAGNQLVLTSIPSHIVGTAGSIITTSPSTTTANTFSFGITNNSGTTQTINYGYIKL